MDQIAIPTTPVKFTIPRMQLVFAHSAVCYTLTAVRTALEQLSGGVVAAERLDSDLGAYTGVVPRGAKVDTFDAFEELSVELTVFSLIVLRVCIDTVSSRPQEYIWWMGEHVEPSETLLSNVRRFSYDVGMMIATAMQRGMEDFALESGSVTVH